jgi:hypothetical protein
MLLPCQLLFFIGRFFVSIAFWNRFYPVWSGERELRQNASVSQRVSVRNFVRPACNTGRRRRSGQGVALTSISFLGRKYSKKFSVGSTRFTYLHCVDLLFSKIADLMLPLMTLIVSQIGSNSIERLNFDFFWNLQLLLKGQGCRPIKLYLSWLTPEYRIV